MISTTVSRSDYLGTGSTGPFSFGFRIDDVSHLEVTKRSAAGVESLLVYATHYTVSGAGTQYGGTVTLLSALAVGEVLTLRRVVPETQSTNIKNAGPQFPEIFERALDQLAMQVQQLREQLNRSIHLPVTRGNVSTVVPTLEPGRVIGVNQAGDGFALVSAGGGAEVSDLEDRVAALEGAPFLPYRGARILNGVHVDFPPDYQYGAFVVLNGDVQPPKIELWANAPFQQPYRLAPSSAAVDTPEDETPTDNVAVNVVMREVSLPPLVRPIETSCTLQMPAVTRAGDAVPVFDAETDEMVMDVDPGTATTMDNLRAGITGNPLLIQAMAGIWSIDVGGGVGPMVRNAIKCMFTPENYRNVLENEFTETTGPLCMSFWFRTTPGADLTTGDPETNPFGVKFMRVQRHTGTYSQTAFANLNGPDRGNGSGVQVRLEPSPANLRLATGDSSLSEGLPFGEPVGSGFPVMSTELWSYLNDGDWHQIHMEILTGPLGYEMFWFDGNLVVDSRIETTKIIQDRSFDGYMRLHFPANLVIAPPLGDPGFAFYYDLIRAWRKGVL